MNVEELHELAQIVVDDIRGMDLVTLLQQLQSALTAQVGDATNLEYQNQVSEARQALIVRVSAGAVAEFNVRWREMVEEMGLGFLLPAQLLAQLDASFVQNQVTPQVVLTDIQALSERVSTAETQLRQLLASLSFLGLDSTALGPGEFEAAVVIPRGEVRNSLSELGQEFKDIETLIRPFVELTSGSPPPLEVKAIASSNFLAIVLLAPAAALALSNAISGVLSIYEKVLNIRNLRGKLDESGLKPEVIEAIEQNATDMVDEEVPNLVRELLAGVGTLPEDGRAYEVETALTKSVQGIAKRIDLGFRMTVRAGPPPPDSEEESESGGDDSGGPSLASIRELVVENQRRAEYQELAGEPILRELTPPEGPVQVSDEAAGS